ncbi:unnamed protein product [Rotaria sp. Silwood2]|nr:unnamed protein product [Rotaria sp. Silwood2]
MNEENTRLHLPSQVVDANSSLTGNNNNGYCWNVAHVTSGHYEQEQSTNKERRLAFHLIVSKLSLFTMINAYKTREQPNPYIIRWQIFLVIAMGVRYLLTFIHSLQLLIYCIKRSPPFSLAIWVHFVEAYHTAGLSLLAFRILPSIDNVSGLIILNGWLTSTGDKLTEHQHQNQDINAKLFVLPYYESAIVEQNLLLNKRQKDETEMKGIYTICERI